MSRCTECLAEMDAAEAMYYEECPHCRAKVKPHRIRTYYGWMSETFGKCAVVPDELPTDETETEE